MIFNHYTNIVDCVRPSVLTVSNWVFVLVCSSPSPTHTLLTPNIKETTHVPILTRTFLCPRTGKVSHLSLSLAISVNTRARRCVTCLGPYPLDSLSNSTPYWPLTLVCRFGLVILSARIEQLSSWIVVLRMHD